MQEFHGKASTRIEAPAATVFDFVTDVNRLPEWNAAIEAVVESPDALDDGARWTVTMHPPHAPRWNSVSRVEQLDRGELRFAYETRNADGNPSYTNWAWQIVADGDAATIEVRWDCYLKTFDRRAFAGPLRKRQLAREVPRSLAALAGAVRSAEPR